MALVWTSAADVVDRWIGGDIPASTEQIERLLGDAEDAILQDFPDMEDRVSDGRTPEQRVQKVAARMVIRYLVNPDGSSSSTTMETAGPFTQTRTVGKRVDFEGGVVLTDADRRDLVGAVQGRAFQIDTTPIDVLAPGQWVTGDTWVPVEGDVLP